MAVTITYTYPQTSAPTAVQARAANMVVATVAASAAADTSAVITHNFALSNAEITQGFPRTVIVPQASEQSSNWFEASQNPNFTVLQKPTADTGPTAKVFIDRPHTIVR